jgi:membrane-bound lytic murein transglycosylase C
VKFTPKISAVCSFLLILFTSPLSLHANEIDLSQYGEDVQDVLLDMAGDDATVFSNIYDEVAVVPLNLEDYSTDVQAVLLDMAGKDPTILSLSQDENSSVTVDFRRGIIEVIANSEQTLKNSIVKTLLTQVDPNDIDPNTAHDFGLRSKSGKPFFYEQILDQDRQSINSNWRALRFADYLIANRPSTLQHRYEIRIYLSSDHTKISSVKYYDLVAAASRRHQVPISLVYGIIETESAFNPKARSGSNAIGLMQILQRQAGREYFQRVEGYDHTPSESYLFNTANNVEVGTAYLAILGNRYLHKIKHATTRQYAVIASYNGGAGNLFKSLSPKGNRTEAIRRLNNMSPSQAYWFITHRHNRKETRNYLKRVNTYQQKYKHLD